MSSRLPKYLAAHPEICHTNVLIPRSLRDEAKYLGVNLSGAAAQGIIDAIARKRQALRAELGRDIIPQEDGE